VGSQTEFLFRPKWPGVPLLCYVQVFYIVRFVRVSALSYPTDISYVPVDRD
jgi:hypothetical protein